ncbi:decanoate-CoA ligase [Aureococcus anophagefferens]|nr:decanoate-CoA ligase [Aureococcus anophagefferens]
MMLDKVLDAWRRAPPTTKAAVVVGSVAAFILYKKKTRAAAARPKPQALDSSNYNTETPKVAFTSDGGVALQRGLSAAGARAPRPSALVDRLEDNASEALAWEDGGNWRSFTWAEYVAQGVGIVGFNSKEWLIADLGAVLAGGFASGIYSTNGPDAVQYESGHCCTLIYTSGTTGRPKAVMISHDNVTWVVASFAEFAIDIYAGLVTVGRSVGCGPVVNAATLFFARPDALKGTLKATLQHVHAAIGLDRAHFLFTGAAPIASSTLEYFGSLGLVVNEAFGMSEVAGPAAVTLNEYYAPGYCGPAVPGVEIKLDHVAGRDKPGEGETREAVDADGWNHSGDTGALVPFGAGAAPMLKITGRIKELLITAGGENVPPVPIEDALKSLLPGVSTAVVVGDKLKFLSVLFTLKQQQNDATGSFDDVLACQAAIDAYNDTAVSSAQKVQKFAILPLDFSQNTGELTPTLKLKRAAVVEKYGFQLKKIDGDAASAVWM